MIAANTGGLFRRLAGAMGRPELAEDPRFATHAARSAHQEACEAELSRWTAGLTAAEIEQRLADAGVPTAPVKTVADLVEDEQLRAREMLLAQPDDEIGPYLAPGIAPKLSATPGGLSWSGHQAPGADNELIFGERLGLSGGERAALARDGIT